MDMMLALLFEGRPRLRAGYGRDGDIAAFGRQPYHSGMAGIEPEGYRLPDRTRVGRVTLQVAHLERSLAFYRDLVGFRLIERTRDDGTPAAALGADGSAEPLVVLREKPGVRPVPRRGLVGLYHFALLLPDRAALGRFVRHAGEAGIPMGTADHLVSEALYLTDPDGLQMEVYADRARSSWTIENREYVMAVDPLDVQSLLAEAGTVAWSGVPAGSTIGHVHFYVGDLTRAAAFYHRGLGFDKVAWSFPGALFVSAGGYHHHVGLNTWAAGAPPASDDDARLLHWDLILPNGSDVAAVVDSLAAQGFEASLDDGRGQARDPWGIRATISSESS
jgi:catechol 2,3-dioxygenase